jgi:hypothetical protein
MRRVLLCAAVMAAQVGATGGMYYLRTARHHPVSGSDLVVFYLPALLALVTYFLALSARPFGRHNHLRLIVRVVGATVLTLVGFWVSMFVALNIWGA